MATLTEYDEVIIGFLFKGLFIYQVSIHFFNKYWFRTYYMPQTQLSTKAQRRRQHFWTQTVPSFIRARSKYLKYNVINYTVVWETEGVLMRAKDKSHQLLGFVRESSM